MKTLTKKTFIENAVEQLNETEKKARTRLFVNGNENNVLYALNKIWCMSQNLQDGIYTFFEPFEVSSSYNGVAQTTYLNITIDSGKIIDFKFYRSNIKFTVEYGDLKMTYIRFDGQARKGKYVPF